MFWPMNLEFAAEADDNNNSTDTTPAYASRSVIETETVDVAYLLRRPLARIRYLAKAEKVDCSAATERVLPHDRAANCTWAKVVRQQPPQDHNHLTTPMLRISPQHGGTMQYLFLMV